MCLLLLLLQNVALAPDYKKKISPELRDCLLTISVTIKLVGNMMHTGILSLRFLQKEWQDFKFLKCIWFTLFYPFWNI